MSKSRRLKKPKKHRINVLFAVLAMLLIAGIIGGIVALGKKQRWRPPKAQIKTEVIEEQ